MVIYNKNSDVVNTVYHYAWKDGVMVGYMITDADGVMEHTVKMLFDETGDSVGYELYAAEDNTTRAFFFLKNLQGDITAVFNEMGECVLEYSYDAWGNIYADMRLSDYESIQASSEAIVYTPITYRGYMYDYYTGLYYLQSRYYNPLYGRFLNVDAVIKTADIMGSNIFTYCNNNPISNVDLTGYAPSKLGIILRQILVLIVAVWALQKYLFKNSIITDVSKFVRDFNGMFYVTFQGVSISGENFDVDVCFGTYNSWDYHRRVSNNVSGEYIHYWGGIIEEKNAQLGAGFAVVDENAYVYPDYEPIFLSVITGVYMLYRKIKTIELERIFDYVWGSNGLDPQNQYAYITCIVSGNSRYAGVYAYSVIADMWRWVNV